MKTYLTQSLILHLLFLISLYLMQWLSYQSLIKITNVHVVEKSIRVDVVELPQYSLRELKWRKLEKMSSAPSISKTRQDKEMAEDQSNNPLEFKTVDNKAKKLKDLLKNFSNKEIPKGSKDSALDKNIKGEEKSDIGRLIVAGNRLSFGRDLQGTTQELESSLMQQYGEQLVETIRPYWKLPQRFLVSNLSCQIKLYISPTGKVVQIEVYRSSGEEEYDRLVIESIKRAAPFSSPDNKIVAKLRNGELVLGFPL